MPANHRNRISRQVTIDLLLEHVESAAREVDEALFVLPPEAESTTMFRRLISVKTHFDILKMLVKSLPE